MSIKSAHADEKEIIIISPTKKREERAYIQRTDQSMRGCVIPVALMHLSLSLSHQQRGISHRYGRLLGYISGERERRLKSRPLNTQSNSAAPIS